MIFLKKLIRGLEVEYKNINEKLASIDNKLSKYFNLLEENSKLKDKILKLEEEKKETEKLTLLREKNIKDLELEIKDTKKVRQLLNDISKVVDNACDTIDGLKNNLYKVVELPNDKTKGNQKMQIYSKSKASNIIKKVINNEEDR